jgi:hypothetical protein
VRVLDVWITTLLPACAWRVHRCQEQTPAAAELLLSLPLPTRPPACLPWPALPACPQWPLYTYTPIKLRRDIEAMTDAAQQRSIEYEQYEDMTRSRTDRDGGVVRGLGGAWDGVPGCTLLCPCFAPSLAPSLAWLLAAPVLVSLSRSCLCLGMCSLGRALHLLLAAGEATIWQIPDPPTLIRPLPGSASAPTPGHSPAPGLLLLTAGSLRGDDCRGGGQVGD